MNDRIYVCQNGLLLVYVGASWESAIDTYRRVAERKPETVENVGQGLLVHTSGDHKGMVYLKLAAWQNHEPVALTRLEFARMTEISSQTNTVGWRLKQKREEKGLSLNELAHQAEIAVFVLDEAERTGVLQDSRGLIRRLAVALDINPRWLKEGDE